MYPCALLNLVRDPQMLVLIEPKHLIMGYFKLSKWYLFQLRAGFRCILKYEYSQFMDCLKVSLFTTCSLL
jgi:hypothetical protein